MESNAVSRRSSDPREPGTPVRVRAERVGQRSEFSRAEERARPDHRRQRRHARIQDSKTADQEEDRSTSGVHHRPRRCLFLSPGHQGVAFPLAQYPIRRDNTREPRMAEAKIYVPPTDGMAPGRTYNQVHRPRNNTTGSRRVSIYVCWSFPGEANRDTSELDNRFSTMTEVRRVEWPFWETPEWGDMLFQQGIAGALELFFRAWMPFQQLVAEVTGNAGSRLSTSRPGRLSTAARRACARGCGYQPAAFGLDHMLTEQEASPDEIDAVGRWLTGEGTVLILGPHHDVGISDDFNERAMEYAHHGDALCPPAAAIWKIHPVTDEGTRRSGRKPIWASSGGREGHDDDRPAERQPRSRHTWLAQRCDEFQFPQAPAPLRRHGRSRSGDPISWAASRLIPLQASSLHRGGQHRVQFVRVDAACRSAGG